MNPFNVKNGQAGKLAMALGLAGLLGFGQSQNLNAQERCQSTEYMQHLIDQDPSILERQEAIEEHTRRFIANSATQRSAGVVYTIPVVFHVVYNGASENIPDYVLQGQLDVINEDFRKINADASTIVSSFSGIAADSEIEFCLATVDPNGNPTTGITRTPTTRSSFSAFSDNVKSSSSGGKDPWPTDEYLNIWVCDIGFGILGYAQFPGGPAATDGVVNDYQYTGRDAWASGPLAPYDLGRTLTHEIGHWLNLRHIWGDGGCSVDDGVSDTPVSGSSTSGCPLSKTTCGSLDNVQNYMDYSHDDCLVMFTNGQATRMRATLAPGGPRASVANNAATVCSTGPASCDVPANPTTTIVGAPTSAQVSWDAVSGAVGYELQGRQVGGAFRDVNISGTSRVFNIFKANRSYEWQVRANCGAAGVSAYTPLQSFTMPSSRTVGGGHFGLVPNPAQSRVQLDLFFAEGEVDVEVMDLTGRVVLSTRFLDGRARAELDLGNLVNGSYIVRATQNGQSAMQRLVVAR
jgi:hypothetical protein